MKMTPTEAWFKKFVAKRSGIFYGSFPHPDTEGECDKAVPRKAPPGMQIVTALFHSKHKSFIWAEPMKAGRDMPGPTPVIQDIRYGDSETPTSAISRVS